MTDTHIEGGRQLRWVALNDVIKAHLRWNYSNRDSAANQNIQPGMLRLEGLPIQLFSVYKTLRRKKSVRPSLQASLVPSSSNHNIGTHHDFLYSKVCLHHLQKPSWNGLSSIVQVQVCHSHQTCNWMEHVRTWCNKMLGFLSLSCNCFASCIVLFQHHCRASP